MGQAAVDLPDPLETPPQAGAPEGAGAAGADDLLSQMAGEEIDRLLADADVEPEPAPVPLTAAGAARALEARSPEHSADSPGTAANLRTEPAAPSRNDAAEPHADLLPDVPGLEVPQTSPAPAAATLRDPKAAGSGASTLPRALIPTGPETSATEDAAVAELFDQLTGGIGGGVETANAAPPDSLARAAALSAAGVAPVQSDGSVAPATLPDSESRLADGAPADSLPASDPDVFEMTAAERAALEAPLPLPDDPLDAPTATDDAPAAAPTSADPAVTHASEPGEPAPIFQYERVALYVRVLEWVNAPFDALPDGARDAIGKVAVMTLVNAVAILIYVLFFRH